MYLKFLNRGSGSASAAKKYLLQKHDHNGEVRADIQVLRGNPSMVTELADSLSFKHRYSSAVIAWHVDDAPTDNEISLVLDDFEKVAFAGLNPNQYAYYAVLHEESNGSKHVHIIVPRVELSTGLSLNIAPPNWQKTYDVLVDKHNTLHSWASAKDLHRKKIVDNKIHLRGDISTHKRAKIAINKAIYELINSGVIKNESDVIKYLKTIDGVAIQPRRSKKTISIKLEGMSKNIKLEGLAYAKGFDVAGLAEELRKEQRSGVGKETANRTKEYGRVSKVFDEIIRDRAEFNQKKYVKKPRVYGEKSPNDRGKIKEKTPNIGRELQEINSQSFKLKQIYDPRIDRGRRAIDEGKSEEVANTINRGISPNLGVSPRNLRPWKMDISPTPNHAGSSRRPTRNRGEKGENTEISTSEDAWGWDRAEEEARSMAVRQWKLGSSFQIEREVHDSVRNALKNSIKRTTENVRRDIKRDNERLSTEYGISKRSYEKTTEIVGEIRRDISRVEGNYRYRTTESFYEKIGISASKQPHIRGAIDGLRNLLKGFNNAVQSAVQRAVTSKKRHKIIERKKKKVVEPIDVRYEYKR